MSAPTTYDAIRVEISADKLSALLLAANACIYNRAENEKRGNEIASLVNENKGLRESIAQLEETAKDLKADIVKYAERLKAWELAATAEHPVADAHAFLDEHNTPLEDIEVDVACDIIRKLLATRATKKEDA